MICIRIRTEVSSVDAVGALGIRTNCCKITRIACASPAHRVDVGELRPDPAHHGVPLVGALFAQHDGRPRDMRVHLRGAAQERPRSVSETRRRGGFYFSFASNHRDPWRRRARACKAAIAGNGRSFI